MRYKNDLLDKFGLHSESTSKKHAQANQVQVNNFSSPSYLRQSSTLIKDALQKGFDVLQLANGDIVTTYTKTVVTKYEWDAVRGKLAKVKAGAEKKKAADKVEKKKTRAPAESAEKVSEDV